jgi:branched-subunit amino acid ABC-type transport system permease component
MSTGTTLLVLAFGPLVALSLWLLLSRTQFGRLIRAAANDREMVGVVGVDVSRLFTGVFALGAWLGGLGGGLAAPVGAIYPGMDVEVIAESFIVVVVGGMGSLTGTLLGALIIGQLNSFGILFFPRFALVFVYVLMVVVLVTRPWGLLGKPLAR